MEDKTMEEKSEHEGLCKSFEEIGLYLVDAGEPLEDVEQDGDVIKAALYRKKTQMHIS